MAFVLVSLVLILTFTTGVFILALMKRDNSLMDLFYGPGIASSALITLLLSPYENTASVLVSLLIILWAARLSIRLYFAKKGKGEDFRYAEWREEWSKKGTWYFVLRTWVQVFLLQGLIMVTIVLPATLIHAVSIDIPPLFMYIGVFIWLLGFAFETVADMQLDAFIQKPSNQGKIMTRGLFRYSRRPNYFGETLMWWGIAVIAAPVSLLAFISPLLITYVVVFVTGPMLEKKWEGNEEYQGYTKRTSYFIPWLPTKG
jgi:steroid 5-alpha reductase family enzyme